MYPLMQPYQINSSSNHIQENEIESNPFGPITWNEIRAYQLVEELLEEPIEDKMHDSFEKNN